MPEPTWLLAALATGFLLALLPALLLLRTSRAAALRQGRLERESELATLRERLTSREQQLQHQTDALQTSTQQLDQARQENTALASERARLATRLEEEARRAAEQLAILNDARQELQAQFQNLANRIFDEKTRIFADQSRTDLDTVLKPFREKITEFEARVSEVYITEGKERHSLLREVQRLQQLNQQISTDAENLTRALRGDSRTQGAWGEIILERVLEESGLRKGIEYDAQGGFRSADGRLLKPDVVIRLPEEKQVIIDSKVSLVAYEKYVRAESDADRSRAAREHLLSIHAHLKGLESKQYDELPGVNSLDFVLMFIPIESAFMLAIDKDRELFSKAFDRNIMIVSPSTLLVTLRTIQNIWRCEHQSRNALEIAEKAGDLYDKFVGFVADLEKIGDQLSHARKAYEGAHNKLVSGKGSLAGRAQALIELGVKSRKQLPASVRQHAEPGLHLVERLETEQQP